jgi:hypothetical protein
MNQNVNEETAFRYAMSASGIQRVVQQTAAEAAGAAPAADGALHCLDWSREVKVDPTSCMRVVSQTPDADEPNIRSLDSSSEDEENLRTDEPLSTHAEINEYFVNLQLRGESTQFTHALALERSQPLNLAESLGLSQSRMDEAVAAQTGQIELYEACGSVAQ